MMLQILNVPEMRIAPGDYDDEDVATTACDKLYTETGQLHMVFAGVYSTPFGWINSNAGLWATKEEDKT